MPLLLWCFVSPSSSPLLLLLLLLPSRADVPLSLSLYFLALVLPCNRRRAASYKELQERALRHKELTGAAQGLALEKALMGKGRKRKLLVRDPESGGKKAVYKWAKQRSR